MESALGHVWQFTFDTHTALQDEHCFGVRFLRLRLKQCGLIDLNDDSESCCSWTHVSEMWFDN